MAGNGFGLAMMWNLKIIRPKSHHNKNTKDEANKQKPNRITFAETVADSDKMLAASCAFVLLCQPLAFLISKRTLSGLKVIKAFMSGICPVDLI